MSDPQINADSRRLEKRPTREVPCNGCTACCQRDLIFMHPECGDDPSQYQTVKQDDREMLAHQENGDCIYLNRQSGCAIHDRRPVVCREMDCRALVAHADANGLTIPWLAQGILKHEIICAARRLGVQPQRKESITGAVCNVCGRALEQMDDSGHRYQPCQRHPRALLRWIPRGSWKLILEDQKKLEQSGMPM